MPRHTGRRNVMMLLIMMMMGRALVLSCHRLVRAAPGSDYSEKEEEGTTLFSISVTRDMDWGMHEQWAWKW